MEESQNHPFPSRRTVLAGGLAATAGLAAPSIAHASASASEGDDSQTNQILAGMGLGSSSYAPAVTSVPSSVTLHSDTQFVPPLLPIDAPLLALVADSVNGTIVTSCTGALGEHNLNGLLKWVDGSTSSYAIDSVEGERVNGHLVVHASGTIKNGHYTGGRVDRLESRLSNDLAACVGGGPVSGTTGSVVLSVTLP